MNSLPVNRLLKHQFYLQLPNIENVIVFLL